jgi:hypothetical protein
MFIYLIDYNYNNWYYVGKTSTSLSIRLKGHKYNSNSRDNLNARVFKKSINEGNSPEIVLIDEGDSININELEQWYISYFKSIGLKLTNMTDGGDGLCGLQFTDNHKLLISQNKKGIKLSEDTKNKISQSNKGIPKPKPNNFGIDRQHSELTKSRISKSNLGKHSDNNRKRSINQIDKITGELIATFECINDAALSINPSKFKSIRSSIESAANPKGKQNTSCGYKWQYLS